MNLERFIRNGFENINTSVDKRELFFSSHLNSMKNNTLNGALDTVINETDALHQVWLDRVFHRKTITGVGKGSTIAIKDLITEIIPQIRELEIMSVLKLKKKSPSYTEGFPSGITEYTKATQGEFRPLLDRLLNFAKKFKPELGQVFVDKFQDFCTRWDNEIMLRDGIKQDIKEISPDFELIWKQVANQLYKNTLTILLASPDNRKILLSYFDFSIVNYRHHTSDDTPDETYKLSIAPATSKTADISFSPDDTLLIINNSNVSVFYYGAATAGEQPKTAPVEIAAGDEAEVTALSLGAPANKFLILINNDATETAEVEIALI